MAAAASWTPRLHGKGLSWKNPSIDLRLGIFRTMYAPPWGSQADFRFDRILVTIL
eukprot:CAMPEP_0179314092 /NCGR_PEP_ID=MMETSP0797-20121207/54202_1 /TAXON_ID=47934 /ORGANISM="Dinophysis acuminata, Strain DAEP01" /LENGTH=54 /DNA_ID=CAMNT_0021024243 /DNA_START=95 /DNA_END=255 /DNA_ORIENTATION=-